MTDAVIIDGARTPFGKFGGSLKDVSATDLGVAAAKAALQRSNLEAGDIEHVVFGNVIQSSPDAIFIARHIGLKTGVPVGVPALTVNRLCGSGLEAIVTAARLIRSGEAETALAGGAENMSQIPFVVRGARWGLPLGATPMRDYLWEALYDTYGRCTMSDTAERVAERYGITREQADEHALRSHRLAVEAIRSGRLRDEIVPVEVSDGKKAVIVDTDEHPRPDTTAESLSRLKPRFKENGVVTAGNASGLNDGAGAVVVTSERYAEKKGLKPLARLVAWHTVGVEPELMGIGPVEAIRGALRKAGLKLEDLDLIEINEAFSCQYLACQRLLGYNPDIGNVNGGAVALGHPLAASGARLVLTLLYELRRRNRKYGATAICIGGGQGIAAIWERL
ncbi:MAG: beta-ketoadipyl CoA thiolase [Candidatus Reconcilbacillus cellulovorans]|uniref:acetyl-CoA C-acetyltransferase n=1 Tax=Candidatus Reconcilbacillus cellulovorans TaxID=1906605 RepID=A0A2A6E203_9BACL|nr:MAG: beta-ketoadipyl CoA thiolase [Candidatus Reconcilbacillus cellulovorans]